MRLEDEDGQALVEFGLLMMLVLPALIAGITYASAMALHKQSLSVAARAAARQGAMTSTQTALQTLGRAAPPDASVYQQALHQAGMGNDVHATGVDWGAIGARRIDDHTALLERTTSKTVDGHTYQFGIGVAFYGVTAYRDLRALSGLNRLTGGKFGPRVSATAVMPAELPPHGTGGYRGVLDENRWIADIVNER